MMKSGLARLAAYHLTVLEAQKAGTMQEPNIKALAAEAVTIKPAGEWGCQALQRQFNLNYTDAVHLLETIREIANDDRDEEPPATAEGQPEQFRDLTPHLHNSEAPAPPAQTGSTSTQPDPPPGWHYGTRGASKGKLVRDVPAKPTAAAPKPTAPEPVPALTITEVPAPDTIALTFHLPPGESFGLLQYFAQSGRPDESAYIARQIALFHAAL